MDSIPKFLASIITIIIGVLLCVSFVISAVVVNSARTYHASVIEEIEASNFSELTIQKCKTAAENDHYLLEVEKVVNPEYDLQGYYKVSLSYNLVAPIFGKVHTGTLVGYATGGAQIVKNTLPGLYESNSNCNVMLASWNELVSSGDIELSGTTVTSFNSSLAGDLVFDDSVTMIGASAFDSNAKITGIYLPSSVVIIGSGAFYGCSNLERVEFEESSGLVAIESQAFYGCQVMESFEFPNGLTTIGDSAFGECRGLGIVRIPASVTSIHERSFPYCTGLTQIIVAEDNAVYHSEGNCLIETATSTLLQGCQTSVMPTDGSVTIIGDYAFYEHASLRTVTIPVTVTQIGYQAFCSSSLMDIHYSGTKEQWYDITFGTSWNDGTPDYTVHCSDGDIQKSDSIPG